MRNILVHDYEGVGQEQVWMTVQTGIPELLAAMKREVSGAAE